jgi:hypothetical protein
MDKILKAIYKDNVYIKYMKSLGFFKKAFKVLEIKAKRTKEKENG